MLTAVDERTEDKIEGLKADLDAAVEVAFKHGAKAWVRLNYPEHFKRLEAEEFEVSLRQFVGH
jgi:hypothetical protein